MSEITTIAPPARGGPTESQGENGDSNRFNYVGDQPRIICGHG